MDYRQIIWLASYPKSGNTWLRCLLDAYFLGEVDINELVMSVSDDIATRYLVGDGSDPRKFPVQVQTLTRPMAMLRMVRQYMDTVSDMPVTVPLYVKTHNAHMIANGIELLPECLTKKTIYLVRDPRDVVISFSKHLGVDMDKAVEYFLDKYRVLSDERSYKMADFICSWPNHVKSYINADTHEVKVLRYEDLRADPVNIFTQVLEYSGVHPEPEKVRRAVDLTRLDKLKGQEQEKGFNESSPYAKNQFFGSGKVGGWREILTDRQRLRIEKECRSAIKRYYSEAKAA